MTVRKRNDNNGHVRGQGHYSASKGSIHRTVTYVLETGKGPGKTVASDAPERKGGFAAKLDKK